MPSSAPRLIGALAVALAAAVGCTLVAPSPATAAARPAWLKPCGTALCGTFPVPLDRQEPESATIGLNVLVIPAASAPRRAEALTILAGGPGGAATDLASWASATFLTAARHEDILLVDQRGTGRSKPLFCPTPAVTAGAAPERIRAYWDTCLARIGVEPRLLTTAVAMDDLDEVRAALGYPRLDVYGGSYGATALQYYLLLHPSSVRTAILDGATSLDVPIFERWARSGQEMLDRLFARCAREPACHAAFPTPARDLDILLARLDRAPIRAGGQTVGRDELANAVQTLSRTPETAARIPLYLRRAVTEGLASVAADVQASAPASDPRPSVMSQAIRCLEPWARLDPAATARRGEGSYLGATMTRGAAAAAAACSAVAPSDDVPGSGQRVRSAVPALVVVGEQDPQDPLPNVSGIRLAMPNARILLVRGGGHGSVEHGCTPRLANAFVQRGTAAGLETSCVRRAPLVPFALP